MSKSWDNRQRVWRHNGHLGSAAMMQAQLNSMIRSDTTTDRTKVICKELLPQVAELQKSLKERNDEQR